MPKINIYNQKGEPAGQMEVSDKVFGLKVNEALVHQAVVAQTANERKVLAHTKDRSEVSGGGKKPWAQKGTGRARQGSTRSPQWVGGGVVFGPLKTRNFSKKINKKMKQKAMCMALSDRLATNNMAVLDKLDMTEYKTKVFVGILKGLEEKVFVAKDKSAAGGKTKNKRSVLVINDKKDDKATNSGRNLVGVEMQNLENINIVDLLKYKNLILTQDAVKKLEERYK